MFLRLINSKHLEKLVSFLYISVQEFFPYMKSLQPFLQTRAFDFWALLLSTNEVESSRSLLVPKLRAESLLLRAFGVGYIKRIQKMVAIIYDLSVYGYSDVKQRNRFFFALGNFSLF